MHPHVEPNATGPIDTALVYAPLPGMPRVTRPKFKGNTLYLHVFQALNVTPGRICPEFKYLGGTLYLDDHITDRPRPLPGALNGRPTALGVALDVLFPEGEIGGRGPC